MANDYALPGKSSEGLDDGGSELPSLERQKVHNDDAKNRPKDNQKREVLPAKSRWENRRNNLPPRLRNQKFGRPFGKNNFQNNNRNASNSGGPVPPVSPPIMPQRVSPIPPPTMPMRVPPFPPPTMPMRVPPFPPPTMPMRVPPFPPPTMPLQLPTIPPPKMPQRVPLIPVPIMAHGVPLFPPPTMPCRVPPFPPPTMPCRVPPFPPPSMPCQVPPIPPPMVNNSQVHQPMVNLPSNPSQMMYFNHCTLMLKPHEGTSHGGNGITSSYTYLPPTSMRPPRTFLELKDTTEKRKFHIARQFEFYFRSKKLLSDSFFLQNMDAEGFVPISLIASFPKVKEQTREMGLIMEALKLSDNLEVAGEKVRLKTVPLPWAQPIGGTVNQAKPTAHYPSTQLAVFPPVPFNAQCSGQPFYFPENYVYQNYEPTIESNSSVCYPRNSAVYNGSYPSLIDQTSISANPYQCEGTTNQAEPTAYYPSTQLATIPPGPFIAQSPCQLLYFPENCVHQNCIPALESNNNFSYPGTSSVVNGVWYPPLIDRLNISTNSNQYGMPSSNVNFPTYTTPVSNF